MKHIYLLILFSITHSKCLAINDVKLLKETIYAFGNQFTTDTPKVSNDYLLTYQEFKSYYNSHKNSTADENKIQSDFQDYLETTQRRTINIKTSLKKVLSFEFLDTISYNEVQNARVNTLSPKVKFHVINAYIIFKCKSKTDTIDIRTEFIFFVFNGKLKFIGECSIHNNNSYHVTKLIEIQYLRKLEFEIIYKNKEKNKGISKYLYLEELENSRKQNFNVISIYNSSSKKKTVFITNKITGDTLSVLDNFSFIGAQAPFLFGVRNDSFFVFTEEGKGLFESTYTGLYQSPGYVDIFDDEKRLFGMYCPYTNVYIRPIYRLIKAVDRDRSFIVVTKSGALGYLDRNGKELF